MVIITPSTMSSTMSSTMNSIRLLNSNSSYWHRRVLWWWWYTQWPSWVYSWQRKTSSNRWSSIHGTSESSQLWQVLVVRLWRHVQREVDPLEELDLQGIQLRDWHPSKLGIESVVVEEVVKELGREHDTSNEEAMDVQGGEDYGTWLDHSIYVDKRDDEAAIAALRILPYSFEIRDDGDIRGIGALKFGNSLRGTLILLIGIDEGLQHRGESSQHTGAGAVFCLLAELVFHWYIATEMILLLLLYCCC